MSDWLKNIIDRIKNLNVTVEDYKKDTVIQSLPSFAYVNRAKKCIEQNKFQEAIDILTEAEALPQEDALVYKYLGVAHDRLFQYEKAIEAYKKSANLNCHDKSIWQKLGFSLVNLGLYDEASEAFENANKINPSNTDVFVGWGMALMKVEKHTEAHEKFVNASKLNRYNFMAIFLAAVMEIKLKLYDEAELKLNFLANVCPNETNTYEYANLKFIKKDYKNALFYARKALDFNKNMLPVYLLMGKIHRIQGEEGLSLECYQNAEELALINSNLFVEWALTLIRLEKYPEAREKLTRASEFDGNNLECKAATALCDIIDGDAISTKNILLEVLEKEPENAIALRGLGIISCVNNSFEEGIRYFKKALEADSGDVINYYYIAEAYLSLKDDGHTREFFEKSIAENPKYLRSYIDYAKYLGTIEYYADAGRKLKKAHKMDENNLEILNLLFFVNFILVKENVCEYNIKETLRLADKIMAVDENAFDYPEKQAELIQMLKQLQEKEQN